MKKFSDRELMKKLIIGAVIFGGYLLWPRNASAIEINVNQVRSEHREIEINLSRKSESEVNREIHREIKTGSNIAVEVNSISGHHEVEISQKSININPEIKINRDEIRVNIIDIVNGELPGEQLNLQIGGDVNNVREDRKSQDNINENTDDTNSGDPEIEETNSNNEEVLNEEVTENNENNENNESETVDNQYYDYESDGAETNSGEQIWYYFVYPEATSNGFQEGYLAQNNKYLEELQTEESEEIAAAGDRLDSNIVPLEEKAPGNSNTWLEVLAVFLPGSIWFLSRYLSKLRGP